METGYKVIDVMTRKPIAVKPSASIEECSKKMAEHHVGSLLVKDNGNLLGIITEQDIVRSAVAVGLDTKKTSVEKIMETRLTTISQSADIFDALVKMRDLNIRQLPVMDNEKMAGLLTLKDVLKIQPQLFDLLVEKFELREEESKPAFKQKFQKGNCEQCGNYSDKLLELAGMLVCENCR